MKQMNNKLSHKDLVSLIFNQPGTVFTSKVNRTYLDSHHYIFFVTYESAQ
jgi:hypothetical protein